MMLIFGDQVVCVYWLCGSVCEKFIQVSVVVIIINSVSNNVGKSVICLFMFYF